MHMKRVLFLLLILILAYPFASAQHIVNPHQAEHADHVGNSHKLTLVMANSFVKNDFEILPTVF